MVMSPGNKSAHLRVDADVLDWFRAQGRGYLTRMNAVPRSYMERTGTIAHSSALSRHSARSGASA